MVGSEKEMLLTDAENLVPLGPWQVWFLGHGLLPRPTVKKKRFWTVCGTFDGNFSLARLRNLWLKFAAKAVSLMAGRVGFRTRRPFFDGCVYSRMPAVVELSILPWPVKYGLADIKKVAFGERLFVFRRTFVVCPGEMRTIFVSKGLT